jgi:hypothetical protein
MHEVDRMSRNDDQTEELNACTTQRDEVIKLARTHSREALDRARRIPDGAYRCQAISWVARFFVGEEFLPLCNEAIASAITAIDPHQRITCAAWPIRALIERGAFEPTRTGVDTVLPFGSEIHHTGALADALFLLFEATFPGPIAIWEPVFNAIIDIPRTPLHWRHARALRTSVLMVFSVDPTLATNALRHIHDLKMKERIERDLSNGRYLTPREFFW